MSVQNYSGTPSRSGKPSQQLAEFLTRQGKVRFYDKGREIFHEGDASHWVFILLDGKAEVLREDEFGNQSVIAEVGPGAIFGEMGIFHEQKRTGTVRASEPAKVVGFTNEDFLKALGKTPELAVRVLNSLTSKVAAANDANAELRGQRDRWIVAYYIMRQWPEPGERIGPSVELNLSEIARDTGASRPSIKAILNELKKRGALLNPSLSSSGVLSSRVDYEALEKYLYETTHHPDPQAESGDA
ncbi:MAG: Crp/Fnr family transcriptional regulator [Pseudomonadota bacterium]